MSAVEMGCVVKEFGASTTDAINLKTQVPIVLTSSDVTWIGCRKIQLLNCLKPPVNFIDVSAIMSIMSFISKEDSVNASNGALQILSNKWFNPLTYQHSWNRIHRNIDCHPSPVLEFVHVRTNV